MRDYIERKNLFVPNGRKGYDEMVALAQEGHLDPKNWQITGDGIHVNIWDYLERSMKRKAKPEEAEDVRKRLGVTEEIWNAIPDSPDNADYWRGFRAPTPTEKGR